DGLHSWFVNVSDFTNNTGASATRTFFIDTTAPVVTLNSPANNSNQSRLVTFNFTTTDNRATSMAFTLFIDGIANRTGTVQNATFNTTTIAIADGFHNWSVTANDSVNNTGNSSTNIFHVDGIPPNLTLISPRDGSVFIGNNVTFNFTATDNNASILNFTLFLDGAANTSGTASNGTTTNVNALISKGIHNYSFRVVDSSGNSNDSATRFFSTDPTIVNRSMRVSVNATLANNNTVTVTGSFTRITIQTGVEKNITVNRVEHNGIPVGVRDFNSTTGLAPGQKNTSKIVNISLSDNTNVTSAVLRVLYTESDITELDENTLVLYFFNKSGENWVQLTKNLNLTSSDGPFVFDVGVNTTDQVVDGQNFSGFVFADLSHFSTYGVAGSPPSAAGTTTTKRSRLEEKKEFIKINATPESVGRLIKKFGYENRQFYITSPELFGVVGALGLIPIDPSLKQPVEEAGESQGRIIDMQYTPLGDIYTAASEMALLRRPRAETVVIARGDLGMDSMAAIAYARAVKAPILLTRPEVLPLATTRALLILNPDSIVVVGGPEAVGDNLLFQLAHSTRLEGVHRYETATKIAEALVAMEGPTTIVVTDGENPSPLAVMVALEYQAPIVYTIGAEVPKDTKMILEDGGFSRVVAVGVSGDASEKLTSHLSGIGFSVVEGW
ncbi:MAG: cell wall-binding repeat-containing protein, partial [Candidatus Hydrothermarchaeota archaeon]